MGPSIGRIVHVANNEGQICPAIVTEVHSDVCINVTRFDLDGSTAGITSLVKTTGAPSSSVEWNWPPMV